MSEIVPCFEIDCTVPADLAYSLQGTANSPLTPVDPPRPYGNQVVYYTPCSEGQNISVDVDLPGWVTIDTVNQRLVGAANTFHGVSSSAANAAAQAILDAFGASHAVCTQCAASAPDTVINLALINIGQCTYMSSNNTLWMIDRNTDVLIRINLNDNSFTTISIPSLNQIIDICYGATQNKLYVSYQVVTGFAHVRVVNPDGTLGGDFTSSVVGFLGSSECVLSWDSQNDRLLLVERTSTPSDDNVEIVDCTTLTSLFLDYAGHGIYSGCFNEATGRFWVTTRGAAGVVLEIDSSFTISNSTYTGRTTGFNLIYYLPTAERIVTRGTVAGEIDVVNATTSAVLGQVNFGVALSGAAWNECTSEVQVCITGIGVVCVDKDTVVDIRQIAYGDNNITGLTWAETPNQSFVAQLTNSTAIGAS